MRVAAIYDIHANLPALEAVLEELRRADVDHVLIGGDVVPGPMPRETISRLMALDLPTWFIRGNGDREVLARRRGVESATVPEGYKEAMGWNAEQLLSQHEALLAGWPETLHVQIPGLDDVLFCHATPRNDTDVFTRLTPEARLLRVFDGVDVPLVVCGHTHMQFDRKIGKTRVVNAGSVGMPFGAPGADWLLLGPGVELRHTPYDLAKAAARVRSTSYPLAEEFAAHYILHPPSEQSMLEVFGRAELS